MVNKFIFGGLIDPIRVDSLAWARAYGVPVTHLKLLHAEIYAGTERIRCSKMSNLRGSAIKTN